MAEIWVARMMRLSMGALGAMLIAPKPVPMCRHITTFSSDSARNTGPPVVLVVIARQPLEVRQFRHGHRTATLGCDAADLDPWPPGSTSSSTAIRMKRSG